MAVESALFSGKTRNWPRKINWSFFRSSFRSFVSHSHITSVRHPRACRAACTSRSRSVFLVSFDSQKLARVLGVYAYWQPEWRCQKQPCTKRHRRNFGNTRSGDPGRSLRCNLKRSPMAWQIERTIISGFVSFPRIRPIMWERCSGETISAPISNPVRWGSSP